jgi:hypothetical protein
MPFQLMLGYMTMNGFSKVTEVHPATSDSHRLARLQDYERIQQGNRSAPRNI